MIIRRNLGRVNQGCGPLDGGQVPISELVHLGDELTGVRPGTIGEDRANRFGGNRRNARRCQDGSLFSAFFVSVVHLLVFYYAVERLTCRCRKIYSAILLNALEPDEMRRVELWLRGNEEAQRELARLERTLGRLD